MLKRVGLGRFREALGGHAKDGRASEEVDGPIAVSAAVGGFDAAVNVVVPVPVAVEA